LVRILLVKVLLPAIAGASVPLFCNVAFTILLVRSPQARIPAELGELLTPITFGCNCFWLSPLLAGLVAAGISSWLPFHPSSTGSAWHRSPQTLAIMAGILAALLIYLPLALIVFQVRPAMEIIGWLLAQASP